MKLYWDCIYAKDNCPLNLFRDNAIEKTILRILSAFDFSHRLVRRDDIERYATSYSVFSLNVARNGCPGYTPTMRNSREKNFSSSSAKARLLSSGWPSTSA